MAKLNFPTKAVVVVAQQLKYREDSNPDVGMGRSFDHFATQAALLLELGVTEYDHDVAVTVLTLNALRSR